jgi:hypothetical protein
LARLNCDHHADGTEHGHELLGTGRVDQRDFAHRNDERN